MLQNFPLQFALICYLFTIGGRKADDIVTWVTRNSGPATTTLETLQEAKDLVEKDQVVIIGYFESTESTEAKAYSAAADSLSDSLTFGITTSKEITEGMEADVDSVVVYKKVSLLFFFKVDACWHSCLLSHFLGRLNKQDSCLFMINSVFSL